MQERRRIQADKGRIELANGTVVEGEHLVAEEWLPSGDTNTWRVFGFTFGEVVTEIFESTAKLILTNASNTVLLQLVNVAVGVFLSADEEGDVLVGDEDYVHPGV